jgi:hypothetical protein
MGPGTQPLSLGLVIDLAQILASVSVTVVDAGKSGSAANPLVIGQRIEIALLARGVEPSSTPRPCNL